MLKIVHKIDRAVISLFESNAVLKIDSAVNSGEQYQTEVSVLKVI